jgi:hypothetical protein
VQEEREKELDEALAHKGVVGSLGLVMAASKQVTVAVSPILELAVVDIERRIWKIIVQIGAWHSGVQRSGENRGGWRSLLNDIGDKDDETQKQKMR